MPPLKKSKPFYGYWIVAVIFFYMFIESGTRFYAFPLFFEPLQAEFSWSRGTISIAFTMSFVFQALASPFIGRLVDRYGAKRSIVFGGIAGGLGFLWLSLMQNLWSFYASYVVVGAGMTAMGSIPATQMVSNWFRKRRGFAVGIMATGVGVGGFVLAPIIGTYLIPNFGWRGAYLFMALLTWVLIIPTTLLVIKERPSDMGLYPDGMDTPEKPTEVKLPNHVNEGWTVNTALKTSTFWLIAVGFFTMIFSQCGIVQHQINYLADIGFPVAATAPALGTIGLCSAIGKFFFGWLCDRIPAKYAAAIGCALELIAAVTLLSIQPTSPLVIIWLYAILMGLGMGCWMPTLSMITSSNFGLASYGLIFGMLTLVQNLSCALGPLASGQMYDAMQTYYWVFLLLLVLYMISIPCMLAVRRPKAVSASS
ncbi:MFS transporter [Chloroflexota bacterium]